MSDTSGHSDPLAYVHDRLIDDETVSVDTARLIVAAMEGRATLESAIATDAESGRAPLPAPVVAPRSVYLSKVTVEGFRGVGPRRSLEIAAGPGLTLVVGRNGSGKSSFAEAAELLLTGGNWRWQNRSRVWKEGWRNLHHTERVAIAVELLVEGEPGPLTVTRTWTAGADIEGSERKVTRAASSGTAPSWESLGWDEPLGTYRPFLSYNELGSMFDAGPTALHDRIHDVLGLGLLTDAAQSLKDARLPLTKGLKAAKDDLKGLLPQLEASEDPRARAACVALQGRSWDLDAARELVSPDGVPAGDTARDALERIAGLKRPDVAGVLQRSERLRVALDARAALQGTDANRAHDLAGLLRMAIDFHGAHGGDDCPVCGRTGGLDGDWLARSHAQLQRLETEAAEVAAADAEAQAAVLAIGSTIVPAPVSLAADAADAGLDATAATEAWQALVAHPQMIEALPDHLDATIGPLDAALTSLVDAAQRALEERESAWKPLADSLSDWLADARRGVRDNAVAERLQTAEDWLKRTSTDIRHDRFGPIAARARELWQQLRRQSSVELDDLVLEGTGPSRRLDLKVSVDGSEGAALGVMSQGELNALALSLFLPRAMLPESPFRFILIDDPVQSMDPARVDGLASVLAEVAEDRQVVVFSHDDRLPEAARRLGIAAHVVEVVRHEDSTVELRQALDPVRRNLDDARALVQTSELPVAVAQQVVPGYCRAAIEAACIEVVRRRRIGRGESHANVEALLEDKSGGVLLALAFFDAAAKTGMVPTRLDSYGAWARDAWAWANKGTHRGARHIDLDQLVTGTARLCRHIQETK